MEIKEALTMIGDRIRNGRKRAILSQTELGERAGYSRRVIAKIERGESDPKYSVLVNIAEALELSVVDLLIDEALVEKMLGPRVNLEEILSLAERIGEQTEKITEEVNRIQGKQPEDATSRTLPDATRESYGGDEPPDR